MTNAQFSEVLSWCLTQIHSTLEAKATEYASDVDRLHNFKKASALLGCTSLEAALALKTKHTVSIADMVTSGKEFPLSVWWEKLGDEINYDVLIYALVFDVVSERAQAIETRIRRAAQEKKDFGEQ